MTHPIHKKGKRRSDVFVDPCALRCINFGRRADALGIFLGIFLERRNGGVRKGATQTQAHVRVGTIRHWTQVCACYGSGHA